MPNEIEVGLPGGISSDLLQLLADVGRYQAIVEKVIATVKAAEHLAPSGQMKLDTIKFRHHGADLEWDLGTLKRNK